MLEDAHVAIIECDGGEAVEWAIRGESVQQFAERHHVVVPSQPRHLRRELLQRKVHAGVARRGPVPRGRDVVVAQDDAGVT